MTDPGQGQDSEHLLGDYLAERKLGTGGMGTVDLWRSRTTGHRFAVKQATLRDSGSQHRFLTELVTWFDLPDHPHLAACRFFRSVDEGVVIFAEFVEAGSLADWIRDRRTSGLREMLDVAIQSAWGLEAAHACGLVHHDIKPGNMLLTEDGVVKLADFGLAKALASATDRLPSASPGLLKSADGMTLAYRSPEQARRLSVNHRTDLWSWAVSVLEMFHGGISWLDGASAANVLAAYSRHGAPDPDLPRMPPRLLDLLGQCLHENPAERVAGAADLAAELRLAYAEAMGQDYPRPAPAMAERSPAIRPDRQTFSLAEWQDADRHLLDILRAAGMEISEIKQVQRVAIEQGQLSPRRPTRRHRAAIAADLVAYEELIRFLQPLSSGADAEQQIRWTALEVDKALVHKALGDIGGALALYDVAAARCEPLIATPRISDQARIGLATVYGNKAETLAQLNDLAGAGTLLRRAVDLLEGVALPPDQGDLLAATHLNLAEVLRRRNAPGEALIHYDRAIASREESIGPGRTELSYHLANAYLTKSNALKALGRTSEAGQACALAVAACERIQEAGQPVPHDRLFEGLLAQADCCRILGEAPAALNLIIRAIGGYQTLIFEHGKWRLRARLANAHLLHGTILFQSKGDIHRAESEMKAGILIYEQAVIHDGERELAYELGASHARLAAVYLASHRLDAAIAHYDKAIAMWDRLPARETQGDRRDDLAAVYLNKAIAVEHRPLPNWLDVQQLYDQAVAIWGRLVEDGHLEYRGDLARAMLLRAPVWRRLRDPARALAETRQWLPILRQEARTTGRADLRNLVAWAENNLTNEGG